MSLRKVKARVMGANNTAWGNWFLEDNEIVFRKGGKRNHAGYYIDLDRVKNAKQCLDWIMQVAGKIWASPQDKADLLDALRDTVNPQHNFCPFAMGGAEE